MINNNQFEKANFSVIIKDDEIGRIEDRLNIIDVFLGTEEHVTLEELVKLLREKGYNFHPDFVRQCMNRWVGHGFAQKETFEGQPPRYEHRHLGKHHDHMICTKCGKIEEFRNPEIEKLQMGTATSLGFHILQHKMEIYGLCSECFSERSILLPLSMAKVGEQVLIKEMIGPGNARGRLSSMGLRPGDTLEIINNNGMGRLIVGHGATRLAMGRGIAQKIMVVLEPQKE
ncbi:MAG: transcriptional repressor [Deltaproteobacteria bacterium]|nr:transcriptional repressor [Deltaproteobacteria bacterium]